MNKFSCVMTDKPILDKRPLKTHASYLNMYESGLIGQLLELTIHPLKSSIREKYASISNLSMAKLKMLANFRCIKI